MGSSLKYLGLGGLVRQNEQSAEATAEEGKVGSAEPSEPAPKPNWWEGGRKRSVAAGATDKDDKNLRFTIAGTGGRRMTKDDFIKEVQKLDGTARKEFVEHSTAPPVVKEAAKRGEVKAAQPEIPRIVEHRAESNERPKRSESISPGRGRSTATKPVESAAAAAPAPAPRTDKPSKEQGETAVERRRRIAVLAPQGEASEKDESPEGNGDTGETPAERRRREAALGLGGGPDSDSEDEGGERVPPARRGIRFAEPSRR